MKLLDGAAAARWDGTPFTYPEVGATDGPLPAGYHHVNESVVVGTGGEDFARHAVTLMTFGVLERAGLDIRAAARRPELGLVVEQRVKVGPVRFLAPNRVLRVIAEERRVGFAFGTIGPHPETGEEEFLLTWNADNSVTFSVRSFSRQARWFSKAGAPIVRRIQHQYVGRFLRALRPGGDLRDAQHPLLRDRGHEDPVG